MFKKYMFYALIISLCFSANTIQTNNFDIFKIKNLDEYTVEVTNPNSGEKQQQTFDLTQCDFKELPEDVDYSNNEFKLELPVTKVKITFKLLTGKDENSITNELKSLQKIGQAGEVTTRLKKLGYLAFLVIFNWSDLLFSGLVSTTILFLPNFL